MGKKKDFSTVFVITEQIHMTTGTKIVFSVTRNHSAEISYKSLKVQVILKKKHAILVDLDITLTNC